MPEATRSLPVRVDLRLTAEERDYLTSEAEKRGISRQDMLGQLVLTLKAKPAHCLLTSPSLSPKAVTRSTAPSMRRHSSISLHPTASARPIVCTVICALTAEG